MCACVLSASLSVVIASLPDTPPVDEGTVLWTIDKTSIAKVYIHIYMCIVCTCGQFVCTVCVHDVLRKDAYHKLEFAG